MTETATETEAPVVEEPTCCHHWLLSPPVGMPQVLGTCKKCGEQRAFQASWDYRWEKEKYK